MKLKVLFAAMILFSVRAAAEPIELINKPLGNGVLGWRSNFAGPRQQEIADEFSLASAATANHLEWYGFNFSNDVASHTFRVSIYEDANGAPAVNHFYDEFLGVVAGAPRGQNSLGGTVFKYQSLIPPLHLRAETYWLSVGVVTDAEWVWSHSNPAPPGNDSYFRSDNAGWRSVASVNEPPSRLDQAFRLQYVPEPSGLLLALASMIIAARFGCRLTLSA